MQLKIAAKVDEEDSVLLAKSIKPLLRGDAVEFIGEINDAQKPDFLSGAHALLFPIDWPEPFGLVMIEAMACGTPGDRVQPRLGAGGDRRRPDRLHRRRRRRARSPPCARVGRARPRHGAPPFRARWTARRMAEDYLRVYERLIGRAVASAERLTPRFRHLVA